MSSLLYEIKATDWNGKTMDGNPFEFVGRGMVGVNLETLQRDVPETDAERDILAKAMETGMEKGRLVITSGEGSDYAHFQVSDPEFNLGKPITYGPGDYVLVLSPSLVLWLPAVISTVL